MKRRHDFWHGLLTRKDRDRLLRGMRARRDQLVKTADALEGIREELSVYDNICANAIWALDDSIRELKAVQFR